MRVVIAGGSGLIGSALSKELINLGHRVTIISRNPESKDLGTKVISWDSQALLEAVSSADAIVNLAGASIAGAGFIPTRWTKRRKAEILESRLGAGELLKNAIQNAPSKPDVFIQASAIGYYGNTGIGPADEKSQRGDDFLTEVCLAWEDSTREIESMGVRRVIARIGLVLSPGGGLFPLLSLPFRLYLGGRIGNGNQYLSWIHIQDTVKSLIHLLENPQTQGVFNLTAPNPVTNREFAEQLGSVLNRPVWFPIPSILLKAALGEAATLALDGREILPGRLIDSGFSFQYKDLRTALTHLV